MSDIAIELTERVKADYQDLPAHVKKKFKKQLRFLAANPRHPFQEVTSGFPPTHPTVNHRRARKGW